METTTSAFDHDRMIRTAMRRARRERSKFFHHLAAALRQAITARRSGSEKTVNGTPCSA